MNLESGWKSQGLIRSSQGHIALSLELMFELKSVEFFNSYLCFSHQWRNLLGDKAKYTSSVKFINSGFINPLNIFCTHFNSEYKLYSGDFESKPVSIWNFLSV